MTDGSYDKLLKPGEVAAIFRVDPKTVTRWAKSGKLNAVRTPGGHARFRETDVRGALVDALDDDDHIS
jgi:excisionase family DNA binding protein